jgi:hypothetical protein
VNEKVNLVVLALKLVALPTLPTRLSFEYWELVQVTADLQSFT